MEHNLKSCVKLINLSDQITDGKYEFAFFWKPMECFLEINGSQTFNHWEEFQLFWDQTEELGEDTKELYKVLKSLHDDWLKAGRPM